MAAEENSQETGNEKKEEEIKQKTFILQSLEEVGNWINYLGGYEYLELAKPILEKGEKILIQSDSFFRKTSFDNLKGRKSEDISKTFTFKYNKKFRNRCKIKIQKSLYICLEPKRYHIATIILKNTRRDLLGMSEYIFELAELLDLFVSMDKENDPILPHLGEVALVCAGLTEHFLIRSHREDELKASLKLALLSGLLHDISLKDDADFLLNDLEKAKESNHEKNSHDFIGRSLKSIDPKVAKIISEHHRNTPVWLNKENRHTSMEQVVNECLVFTEYFFMQIRMSYSLEKKERTSLLEKVFFNIGHSFGNGFFHPLLFEIMAHLQDSFQRILIFGEQIASLENKCLFKDSAVAYPVPLCSQILCKDKRNECELVFSSRPISVVQKTKLIGRSDDYIFPGTYPKCKLSEHLPSAPKEISGL